jgi:hypothetical protein
VEHGLDRAREAVDEPGEVADTVQGTGLAPRRDVGDRLRAGVETDPSATF